MLYLYKSTNTDTEELRAKSATLDALSGYILPEWCQYSPEFCNHFEEYVDEKDTASDIYLDALVPASLHHSIGAEVGTPLSLAVVCQNVRNRNQVLTCFTGTKVLAYWYKSTNTDT